MLKKIKQCEICGITSVYKRIEYVTEAEKYLCDKHRMQFSNHGKFFDKSPRGIFDKNEIRIYTDYAEIDTYDQYGNVVTTFKIDLDNVDLARSRKWRTVFKLNKPYLFSGNQHTSRVYFHRLIIDCDNMQVDHISGDTSDNRKQNLRIVTIQDNMKNLQKKSNNTSGIRGVSFDKKKNRWKVDFTYEKIRIYPHPFKEKSEAVYCRYCFEKQLLGEYRNTSNDSEYMKYINSLTDKQKHTIEQHVKEKLAKDEVQKI